MRSLKKNRSFFLVRVDDIHSEMDHIKFQRMIDIMTTYNLAGILGVIPDNQDLSLKKEAKDPLFWDKIKKLEASGYAIAQHGYQHLYDTQNGGILNLNSQSEFAGHPYAIQKEKMKAGKKILEQKGLSPTLFMAPSHSFDQTTLIIAKKLGYGITDGFGLWPRVEKGLLVIPQLFASPVHFGIGVYTICLHTDNMTEYDFVRLEKHLEKYHKNYISPLQLSQHTLDEKQYFLLLLDKLLGKMLQYLLRIKRQFVS